MSRNMYKNASNSSRIKLNTRRRQENYIYWKFLKGYSRRLVSTSLDLCPDQMEWMP